jgi:hypothetical protein
MIADKLTAEPLRSGDKRGEHIENSRAGVRLGGGDYLALGLRL